MLADRDLPLEEVSTRLQKRMEHDMLAPPVQQDHSCDPRREGTGFVPYDGLIGVTPDGVPVMSNGDELKFSDEQSITPGCQPLSSEQCACPSKVIQTKLGYKWQCVEFVRRYLASRKLVWLLSIPTAEDIWTMPDPIARLIDGEPAKVTRTANGSSTEAPSVGDLIVWARGEKLPFGHVAVVVSADANGVRVAEQNHGFMKWLPNALYSREIDVRTTVDGKIELISKDEILGWMSVHEPLYDFAMGDLADNFRLVTGRGTILRKPVSPDTRVPWIDPASGRCDYFLKRSLTVGADTSDTAVADEHDVPSAFYYLDYDMWCRIGRAANSLHSIAMEATRRLLEDPDAEFLLEHYFGVPPEIQPLLRRSWEMTPPFGGRFDFGYDGKRIVMLEYNCDSSGALLECCDTQEKMAKHYGVSQGTSTGSFLGAKCVAYFKQMHENERACPTHKLIHFMIDNDDEERYTAFCVMGFAEQAGFRTKLCVGVDQFRYRDGSPVNAAPQALPTDHPTIVDLDDEEVLLVWKTWSWDTVLHQYADQRNKTTRQETPSLSDILLNNNIRVLEPLWKAVTGSKAILPYMHALAPDHQNMVAASFVRTREIASKHHISKPVNGRAGQNIVMYDPVTDESELQDVPEGGQNIGVLSPHLISPSFPQVFSANQSFDRENECSAGRFFDSVLVYQQRLFLKKFDHKYFPIFCGWMIGDEFGGIVVREDTSKITKLASVVIPARVVRNNEPLGESSAHTKEEET